MLWGRLVRNRGRAEDFKRAWGCRYYKQYFWWKDIQLESNFERKILYEYSEGATEV